MIPVDLAPIPDESPCLTSETSSIGNSVTTSASEVTIIPHDLKGSSQHVQATPRTRSARQPPFDLRDWLIAAAVMTLCLVLGWLRMVPGITGVYHDDGIYVATAKSLAEGHGYHLINLPGAPLQTKYPVLYPLVLALLWHTGAFPANVAVMQVFSVVCTGLSFALGYLYVVRFRHGSRWQASSAAIICATSALVLFYATLTLSESLFAVALIASLWIIDHSVATTVGHRMQCWSRGVVVGLTFLIRVLAAPFLGAFAVVLLCRDRRHVWTVAGIASIASIWVAWILIVLPKQSADSATAYYTATPYLLWWFGDPSLLLNRVLTNVILLFDASSALAASFLIGSQWIVTPIAIGALTWLTIARAALRRSTLALGLLCYAGTLLVWPWQPLRFLVPIIFLTTVYLHAPLHRLFRLFPPLAASLMMASLTTAVSAANLVSLEREIAVTRTTGYPRFRTRNDSNPWAGYVAVFDWVKQHTDSDDIIASGMDPMVYLYTNRRAVRPFATLPSVQLYGASTGHSASLEEFLDVLVNTPVRYVVRVPMPDYSEEPILDDLIARLRQQAAGCLYPRFTDPEDSRYVVYEVHFDACPRLPAEKQ
jgi:hypothetical protein